MVVFVSEVPTRERLTHEIEEIKEIDIKESKKGSGRMPQPK